MPETPAYLYDDPGFGKHDVVPTTSVDNRNMDPVSHPTPVELPTERKLRGRITLPLSLHPSQSFGPRRGRDLHNVEKR